MNVGEPTATSKHAQPETRLPAAVPKPGYPPLPAAAADATIRINVVLEARFLRLEFQNSGQAVLAGPSNALVAQRSWPLTPDVLLLE